MYYDLCPAYRLYNTNLESMINVTTAGVSININCIFGSTVMYNLLEFHRRIKLPNVSLQEV
jgi:hypothetical protein